MPWVTLNENLENLPGHGDPGDGEKVSPLLVEFWVIFSGETLYAKEPEKWASRCDSTIVWRLDDQRVYKFLESKGLPPGSSVLLCPHQVVGIHYSLGPPKVVTKEVVTEKLLPTVRRKFRHE